MNILNSYPLSKKVFLGWMIEEYAIDEKTYNQAPFEERCRVIARYLGYPIVFPSSWTNEYLERKIHDYLYLYEKNLRTYPFGVPDPIKVIERMSFEERKEKFPDEDTRVIVLPGLNAALIERTNYQDNTKSAQKTDDSETNNIKNNEDIPF